MPSYLLVIIRALLAYFILLLLAKGMGKREISQMTFFDYIVGITIGSMTAQMVTVIDTKFIVLLPSILVFTILQIITSYITLKNRHLRVFFEGSKTILIEKGKIIEKNMAKERINIEELQTKLRNNRVFKLADVDYAYLETDGKISVMKKANKQPVTPSDLQIEVEYTGIGHLVIEEGIIMGNVLKKNGLTKAWLEDKLNAQGIKNFKEVMYAQVDDSGKLFIDLYETK